MKKVSMYEFWKYMSDFDKNVKCHKNIQTYAQNAGSSCLAALNYLFNHEIISSGVIADAKCSVYEVNTDTLEDFNTVKIEEGGKYSDKMCKKAHDDATKYVVSVMSALRSTLSSTWKLNKEYYSFINHKNKYSDLYDMLTDCSKLIYHNLSNDKDYLFIIAQELYMLDLTKRPELAKAARKEKKLKEFGEQYNKIISSAINIYVNSCSDETTTLKIVESYDVEELRLNMFRLAILLFKLVRTECSQCFNTEVTVDET